MALSLRSVWHLLAIIAVTLWGLFSWPLPLPGVFAGAGALLAAVVMWALFLSPRPVLRTDRFALGLIELVLLAAAVAALLSLGVHWLIAAAFGIIGAVLGFIAGKPKEQA